MLADRARRPLLPFDRGRRVLSGPRRAFAACVLIARADVQDRRGVLP